MVSEYERTGVLQRKINVFRLIVRPNGERYWAYEHSTNWHKRCRDAVDAASRKLPGHKFIARFA